MIDSFDRDEIARFGGLLDSLNLGVVSVDSADDFAHVNHAAAELIGFPAGVTTASAFTAHMTELARRSVNSAETLAMVGGLCSDPSAELTSTWLFPESPTHWGWCPNLRHIPDSKAASGRSTTTPSWRRPAQWRKPIPTH